MGPSTSTRTLSTMSTANYAQMDGNNNQTHVVPMQGQQQYVQPTNIVPDEGIWYWVACVFCNGCGCGLAAIALSMHCVAQALFETNQTNPQAAANIWEKARKLRLASAICGGVVFVIFLIYYIAVGAAVYSNAMNAN